MHRRLRSLVQFRLATLLIAITLIGVWLGVCVNRANRQKRAIAAITAARGVIQFDYERDKTGNRIADAEPPGPKQLRKLIGDEFFRSVVVVDFATEFYGERKALGLSKVDDDGLRCLESLSAVEVLELGHNRAVTDAGLVHLRYLSKLRTLYLYDCGVTGTGCVHLARLPNLTCLMLTHNQLTPAGIAELSRMRRLTVLDLSHTPVADSDLAELVSLVNLQNLSLHNTNITDRGVLQLQKLRGLKEVSLPAGISDDARQRLRQSLPQCQIYRAVPDES